LARPPASRPGLDREIVVRTAAELVNAGGLDALTINHLARELQVQPSSLYNHIDGLGALWRELALLNMRALGRSLTDAAVGRSGTAGVMALAQAYRDYVKQNPGLYQASLRASRNDEQPDPELQEAEDQIVRVALAVVDAFGRSGEDAVHAVRGLRSAIHGFATLEVSGGFGLPLDLDESFRRLIDTIIRGMQRDPGES
jgi:AcrR family transcriptional regulator